MYGNSVNVDYKLAYHRGHTRAVVCSWDLFAFKLFLTKMEQKRYSDRKRNGESCVVDVLFKLYMRESMCVKEVCELSAIRIQVEYLSCDLYHLV